MIFATSCGLTQYTRERTSGDPKRVSRGGGALSGELDRARGSRRRRKSAHFGRHSRPDAEGIDQLAVVVIIVAEQERAEMGREPSGSVQPTTTNSWRLMHFDLRHSPLLPGAYGALIILETTPSCPSWPACRQINSPSPVSWPLNCRPGMPATSGSSSALRLTRADSRCRGRRDVGDRKPSRRAEPRVSHRSRPGSARSSASHHRQCRTIRRRDTSVFAPTFASASTTLGYLSLQSSPVRVSNCTSPRSMRANIRKPSSLISWSHCGPEGAVSTSRQSWGGSNVEAATPY